MIDGAVEFIRSQTRAYLGDPDDAVLIASARKLIEEATATGAVISVVNCEEETALKNQPHIERQLVPNQPPNLIERNPPVFLNVTLLFAFEFQTYAMSLNRLGQTVEFFQQSTIFNRTSHPTLPVGIERITMEMVNMDFEELNHLWGILGGSYFPSVVYKMRVLAIQGAAQSPAPRINVVNPNTDAVQTTEFTPEGTPYRVGGP